MPSAEPPGQTYAYPHLTTDQPTSRDRKCCAVIEGAAVVAREKRGMRKPQPWVVLKMVIPLVFGIMAFAVYAYVSQICLPMIDRTTPTLGSRATGIVLLVIFATLFLWLFWAYFKVILTSPGYAKEFTRQSERPLFPPGHPPRDDTGLSISTSYDQIPASQDNEGAKLDSNQAHKPSISVATYAAGYPRQQLDYSVGLSYEEQNRPDVEAVHRTSTSNSPQTGVPASDTNPKSSLSLPTQASPVPTMSSTVVTPSNRPSEQSEPTVQPGYMGDEGRERRRTSEREKSLYRKAPSTPVLSPVLRYCEVDRFIKPYRAHHCRACGTCVLKYDHHCPWIGGCVGARNHKFFINFCFATSIFTAFVFATVLPFMLKAIRLSNGLDGFDPRLIVLLALAGVFFLFTILLCVNHVNMITHGQTTVESMNIRGMKERDDHVLARGFGWWEVSAKRDKKKAWNKEWGDLDTEGNIWWRGSAYEEWVDVMGKNWLGWIFPIGRGISDGSSYPVNPRFDEQGRIRRRSEWPKELR